MRNAIVMFLRRSRSSLHPTWIMSIKHNFPMRPAQIRTVPDCASTHLNPHSDQTALTPASIHHNAMRTLILRVASRISTKVFCAGKRKYIGLIRKIISHYRVSPVRRLGGEPSNSLAILDHHPLAPAVTAHLSTFPFEICEAIFAFACTDDGSTGRSLSLVSRSIRNASRGVKYQCLAVTGRQAEPLCMVLNNLPESDRRIRHLFFSSAGWEDMYVDDSMLILLSPHLYTLQSVRPYFMFHDLGLLEETQFPFLTDLTLKGDLLCYSHAPGVLYPSLRRLHLWGEFKSVHRDLFEYLTGVAPMLTHLRLSYDPVRTSTAFLTSIEKVISQHCLFNTPHSSPLFLPKLQKFILQPDRVDGSNTPVQSVLIRLANTTDSFSFLKAPQVEPIAVERNAVVYRFPAYMHIPGHEQLRVMWDANNGTDAWVPTEKEYAVDEALDLQGWSEAV